MAEVDGQSFQAQPVATPHPSEDQNAYSHPEVLQSRTVGGFLVDGSEGDDGALPRPPAEAAKPSGSLLNVDDTSSNTPSPSVPQSPNNARPAPNSSCNSASLSQPPQDVAANGIPGGGGLGQYPARPTSAAEKSSSTEPAQNSPSQPQKPASPNEAPKSLPRARLPHDRVGILEDRIQEDPRGDMEAWMTLLSEHKSRNKVDDVRNTYERMMKVFPTHAEQWIAYVNFELERNNFYQAEHVFNRALPLALNVTLWSNYLNYIRRRHNLNTDSSGSARQVISESFEFVLNHVGVDKDSGPLWQDYIKFIQSGPGKVGKTEWQDQQKMDTLRKAFQRATCIPHSSITGIWKDYDNFEMGLNKMTGRKLLQEKSSNYVTARSSSIALQNITRELNRSTQPALPPVEGFDGDKEYQKQVDIWNNWIKWEKDDPLGVKDESAITYKNRILYVYKQAVVPLRFLPEMWFDAADFCFKNALDEEGTQFLRQGAAANPESCLLAFRLADRIEITTSSNQNDSESLIRRGEAVRQPYNKVLSTLYEIYDKTKERELRAIAQINEEHSNIQVVPKMQNDDDDADALTESQQAQKTEQIVAVQRENKAQLDILVRLITHSWIALMRAMRRVQGKGKAGDAVGGSRNIFHEARKRGRLNYEFWVANALLEKYAYHDNVGDKIFERAYYIYPDDEKMALAYVKHLISLGDDMNARSAFKKTTEKLIQKPESREKAKPLFAYFHEYESKYSELHLIQEIENRMSDLFPEDPKLQLFSRRYAAPDFDPCSTRPIVSPQSQTRPKDSPFQPKDQQLQAQPQNLSDLPISPKMTIASTVKASNSPKRPLEDSDNEGLPAAKIARGNSPLKGAAGRRLNAAKRTQLGQEVQPGEAPSTLPATTAPPPKLPPWVDWLLTATPKTELYTRSGSLFNTSQLIKVIRNVDLAKADFQTWSNWLRDRQNRSQPLSQRVPPSQPPPHHTLQHQPPPMQHQPPLNYSAPPPLNMQMPTQPPQMATPQYGYPQPNRVFGYGR